jgi:DNA helicase TIP49 (TBP-interacting protein)
MLIEVAQEKIKVGDYMKIDRSNGKVTKKGPAWSLA